MIGYIRQGILDGESLVWKSDFEDWRNLSATELRAYLPARVDCAAPFPAGSSLERRQFFHLPTLPRATPYCICSEAF